MMSTTRMFVDPEGVEWEVFDESEWTVGLALAFDHPPQTQNPGLLFISSRDMRRLWPSPERWRGLEDDDLATLCSRAASLQ